MKILGIGEAIIDTVIKEGSSTQRHVGGPVVSALIVLSRLGMECTMVTTLGRDSEAKLVKKALKHEKIKLLQRIAKHTKTNTIVVNNDGTREKIRGSIVHADIKNLDRKFVRQFDYIVIDRHEKTALAEVIAMKKPGAKIVIDPSTEVSDHTRNMIARADYPIIPIEALARMDCVKLQTALDALYALTKKTLIITAGNLGSIIYNGSQMELIPAYEITAVDVNGAGDVYRGAFTYAVIQNWDMVKSATFANFVAGLQCTKLGNMSAIPTKAEMDVFAIMYQRKAMTLTNVDKYFTDQLSL